MKNIFISLLLIAFATTLTAQKIKTMKLNAGYITEKIKESKKFYTEVLDFGVTFESDFYLLLHTPNHQAEISFLQPNHPSQHPMFQKAFDAKGAFLTIEVDDVDALYEKVKARGAEIVFEIRDEVWGDRHFAIKDPNGIGIDLVRYTKPEE